MKHLLILFFLLTTNAFAQGPLGDYAVVKDKDGYVNIRAKENVKSKIVGTLPNNTLVYGFFDKEFNPTNWIEVDKDVKVTITKQKFDKTKHKIIIKKHKYYEELIIDGKIPQGAAFIPENHYKSIIVTMKGKNVSIPKSAYDDLYEIFYFSSSIYYDEEAEALYIFAHNSEASFVYQVCWQIVKGEYITRIIGQPL